MTADGQDAGFEEYYDYIFPDSKNLPSGLKLVEAAQKWKEQAAQQQQPVHS
jgi:crooked neck